MVTKFVSNSSAATNRDRTAANRDWKARNHDQLPQIEAELLAANEDRSGEVLICGSVVSIRTKYSCKKKLNKLHLRYPYFVVVIYTRVSLVLQQCDIGLWRHGLDLRRRGLDWQRPRKRSRKSFFSFFSWSERVFFSEFFSSCFLTFFFSFIDSQPCCSVLEIHLFCVIWFTFYLETQASVIQLN